MRILATLQPAWSHLNTIVPFAEALQRRGHDVRVASSASVGPALQARGLHSVAAGLDWDASRTEDFFPGFLRARARRQVKILTSLAGQGMVDDLLEMSAGWRPELIVRESSEFGGLVLGELLDVPVTVVGIGLRPPTAWLVDGFGPPLLALRRQYGLPEGEPGDGLMGSLWLSSYPPTFGHVDDPIPHERFVKPVVPGPGSDEPTPSWWDDIGDNAVYVTLGTVFNESRDLLRLLAIALAEVGLQVVATTGSNIDPQSLGPMPSNVHLASYVTQSRLSSRIRAVVSHGGFNTVMSALAAGLPVCCIPLSADHPFTAIRCVELGVGTSVTTMTPAWGPPIASSKDVTAAEVVDAVMPLLDEPAYRTRAEGVAATVARLPGPDQAAQWIEQIGRRS